MTIYSLLLSFYCVSPIRSDASRVLLFGVTSGNRA
nr:MAG TPA: hypothetical protein [Microviridae sp.]